MLCLSACGNSGEAVWREQVLLADGRVAIAERRQQYHDTRELGGLGERVIDRTTLSFTLPGNQTLPALTTGIAAPDESNPKALPTGEIPLIFDVDADSRVYFVITIVDHCHRARELGLDSGVPYFEYRLADNGWRRQPVSAARVGWKTNLLIARSAQMGPLISLEEKAASNGSSRYRRFYKSISSHVPC